MKRRLIRLLLPIPAAALLASCTASAKDGALTSQEPSLPTTIASPEESATDLNTDAASGAVAARDKSFGVAPPSGWVEQTDKQPKTILFLKDPKPAAKIFRTFSVVQTSLKKPQSLDKLVEQGMIGQRQKGATVTKVADRRIGGVPAAGYRMTRTAKNDAGGIKVAQSQFYMVRGSKVFITTMTAAASNTSDATTVQDAILRSWSWGEPSPPTESGSASGDGSGEPSSTSTPSAIPSAS